MSMIGKIRPRRCFSFRPRSRIWVEHMRTMGCSNRQPGAKQPSAPNVGATIRWLMQEHLYKLRSASKVDLGLVDRPQVGALLACHEIDFISALQVAAIVRP